MKKFLEMVRANVGAITAELGLYLFWFSLALPAFMSRGIPVQTQGNLFLGTLMAGCIIFIVGLACFDIEPNKVGSAVGRPLLAFVSFLSIIGMHWEISVWQQGAPWTTESTYVFLYTLALVSLSVGGFTYSVFYDVRKAVCKPRTDRIVA